MLTGISDFHSNVEWDYHTSTSSPFPNAFTFREQGIDNTKTWDFFCSAGQNSGKWKKIEVPCNWELQGFGEYTYGRWYTIKRTTPQ